MVVEYRNLDVNPTDGTIKFDLRLTNTSVNVFDARKIKLRYWFTNETPGTDWTTSATTPHSAVVTSTCR